MAQPAAPSAHFGALLGLTNLSTAPVRLEAWAAAPQRWVPLPLAEGLIVPPTTAMDAPNGITWLPRSYILRTVHAETGVVLQVHGALGEAMRVIQHDGPGALP